MSRQIQIRRGTAAENNAFTGAIGEITMDTTNKTLRVHDGTTAGGTILAKQSELPDITTADYIIESQMPTAENNYTWYRKYKSGWVEQGGIWSGSWVVGNGTSGTKTINIPVTMNDTNYTVLVEMCKGDSTGGDQMWSFHETQGLTTTSFSVVVGGYNNSRTITRFVWQLSGVAA